LLTSVSRRGSITKWRVADRFDQKRLAAIERYGRDDQACPIKP
jgi:hypothetical protein